ncbi:MAG TPA: hypothetical protein VNL16_17785 [Chloroflexota bacterium]|nr:hypothetical protein [Chloroflexota bacterium]
MTALDLLADLRSRGIELQTDGDQLRYRPADALTEADRALLAGHKAELLLLLAAESVSPTRRHLDGPTPPCPKCGGPTHDAADHRPGIVVLLCDDGERCRWGLAMRTREYQERAVTGVVLGTPEGRAQ